jgi:hypothetical protein
MSMEDLTLTLSTSREGIQIPFEYQQRRNLE